MPESLYSNIVHTQSIRAEAAEILTIFHMCPVRIQLSRSSRENAKIFHPISAWMIAASIDSLYHCKHDFHRIHASNHHYLSCDGLTTRHNPDLINDLNRLSTDLGKMKILSEWNQIQ